MFFFKQKTAYEMRISDWSSDVCSSDLAPVAKRDIGDHHRAIMKGAIGLPMAVGQVADDGAVDPAARCHDDRPRAYLAQLSVAELGRASCRESVCQYV